MTRNRRNEAGLSLLEICIALIVVGLLMIPVIYAYQQEINDQKRSVTETNLVTVKTALQQYYFAHNRFPCPAEPSFNKTMANYGQEFNPAIGCTGSANIVRDAANKVTKGAVPFAALGISADQTLDGWNRKLIYVVTIADTSLVNPVNLNGGAISVTYLDPNNLVHTDAQVAFVIGSYGDDGLGAYTVDGIKLGACPAAPVNAETPNCNNGTAFFTSERRRSLVPGVNYFDDLFEQDKSYLAHLDTLPWAYSPPKAGPPATAAYTNVFSADYIGIHNRNPVANLDIAGSLLVVPNAGAAVKGDAMAGSFCDTTGQNCFPASIIAGPIPAEGMGVGAAASATLCPTGTAMTGIGGKNGGNTGFADCTQHVPTSGAAQTCGANQYINGFDASGNVICKP